MFFRELGSKKARAEALKQAFDELAQRGEEKMTPIPDVLIGMISDMDDKNIAESLMKLSNEQFTDLFIENKDIRDRVVATESLVEKLVETMKNAKSKPRYEFVGIH